MKKIIVGIYFIVFIVTFQFCKAQENVTNSLDANSKIGTLLFNKKNSALYIKFKDCVDSSLYQVKFDEQNWKVNLPKWLSANDATALLQFSLPVNYYRLNFYLQNHLNGGVKNYVQILKNEIKKGGIYYVGREGVPVTLDRKEGTYKIPGECEIEIKKNDTVYQFSIKYIDISKKLRNLESEPIEKKMFSLNSSEFSRVSCFSIDEEKERASISFDIDTTFLIKIFDLSKNQFFKDSYNSNFGFNYIEKKFMSKKRTLYYLDNFQNAEIEEIYNKAKLDIDSARRETTKFMGQVSPKYTNEEIEKMKVDLELKNNFLKENGSIIYSTETSKNFDDKIKKIEKIEYYPGLTFFTADSKVFNNYVFNGGFDKYNDSLIQIINLTDYQFKGYSENQNFVLTGNAVDPLKKFITYSSDKINFSDLSSLCPNKPSTVNKIIALNNELTDAESKINLAQSAASRYTFNTSEQKDANGAVITEVKVLKDCKNLDLNTQTERDNLKALLKERNGKVLETISSVTNVINNFTIINNEINACKTESSGSSSLDGISNAINKGGLKVSLIAISSKATKLLESSKKANEELQNYTKILDSYKKAN